MASFSLPGSSRRLPGSFFFFILYLSPPPPSFHPGLTLRRGGVISAERRNVEKTSDGRLPPAIRKTLSTSFKDRCRGARSLLPAITIRTTFSDSPRKTIPYFVVSCHGTYGGRVNTSSGVW